MVLSVLIRSGAIENIRKNTDQKIQ